MAPSNVRACGRHIFVRQSVVLECEDVILCFGALVHVTKTNEGMMLMQPAKLSYFGFGNIEMTFTTRYHETSFQYFRIQMRSDDGDVF